MPAYIIRTPEPTIWVSGLPGPSCEILSCLGSRFRDPWKIGFPYRLGIFVWDIRGGVAGTTHGGGQVHGAQTIPGAVIGS